MAATCGSCKKNQYYFQWKATPRGNRLYDSRSGAMHHVEELGRVVGCVDNSRGLLESRESVGITLPDSAVDRLSKAEATASKAQQIAVDTATQFAGLGIKQEALSSAFMQLKGEFSNLNSYWEQKLTQRQQIELVTNNGVTVSLGRQHKNFELLLRTTIALHGSGVPFLIGEPGSFKTSAVEPLTKALSAHHGLETPLPFYIMSVNNQSSKSDFFGFVSGHGEYQETPLYKVARYGGVLLIDEVDAGNANVLVGTNTIATNPWAPFPHMTFDKHPHCYIIAAGNTIGAGADEKFIGRNQLDMATRTRFAFIHWDTDWELVAEIVESLGGTREWAIKVQQLHDACLDRHVNFVVSSRVALGGVKMLKQGISERQVLESLVWANMSQDERRQVETLVGIAS